MIIDCPSRRRSTRTDLAFAGRRSFDARLQYDRAGQRTGVDSSLSLSASFDSTYIYGANGHRSSATEPGGGTDSYAAGAQNRVSQDSTYSYVYDAEGNLIERRLLAGDVLNQRFAWDHRNRLMKFEEFLPGGFVDVVDFRYGAAGALRSRSLEPGRRSNRSDRALCRRRWPARVDARWQQ